MNTHVSLVDSANFDPKNLTIFISQNIPLENKYGGKMVKILYDEKPLVLAYDNFVETNGLCIIKHGKQFAHPIIPIQTSKSDKPLLDLIRKIWKCCRILLYKNRKRIGISITSKDINNQKLFPSIIKYSKSNNDLYPHLYPKLKCKFNKQTGKIEDMYTRFYSDMTDESIKNLDKLKGKKDMILYLRIDSIYIVSNIFYLRIMAEECIIKDINIKKEKKERIKLIKLPKRQEIILDTAQKHKKLIKLSDIK